MRLGKILKAVRNIKGIQELVDSGIINPEMIPELKALVESVKRKIASGDGYNTE